MEANDIALPEASSPSLERLHPTFPGEARVFEMFRSFWPFTRGNRGLIALQVLLSLALFAATAVLPLRIGNLLNTALSVANADRAARQAVVDPADVKRVTLKSLSPDLADRNARQAAAMAIDATQDELRLRNSSETLDALFPNGMSYRTRDLENIDEPSVEWEQLAQQTLLQPRVGRADLERLIAQSSTSRTGTQAYSFITNLLFVSETAKEQRKSAQNHRFITELVQFAAVLLSIFLLRAITLFLALRATLTSARRLHNAVFERVHDTALVDAGALARPSMVSRCTSYVDKVAETLTAAQFEGVPALAAVVFSVGLLLYIDVPIGLIMVGVIALFEVLRRLRASSWSRLVHERLDVNTELSEIVDSSIATSEGIRALGAQAVEQTRFGDGTDKVIRYLRKLEGIAESFRLSAFGLGQIGVLIVIALVGFVRKDLNLAEATAVVLYVREVSSALEDLPGTIVNLQEAAPYMRRLRRVLAAPLRRPEPEPFSAAPSAVDVLTVHDVHYRYPDDTGGCSGISFHADRHCWTVLVGTDSSGTHALLDVVAGLEAADRGTVRVDATDLADLRSTDLRRLVAVLPPNPVVFEGTVLDNVLFGAPTTARPDLDRIITACGLDRWIRSLPDGLNTVIGQRRQQLAAELRVRINVARLVACSAPIVAIDDPTGALDREVADSVWAVLRSELHDRIVVMTTRRIDLLGENDRIITLVDGAAVEQGTRAELLRNGRSFPRLWARFVDGDDRLGALAVIPALASLSTDALRNITTRLVTERFEAGQSIFEQGEPADRVFLVVDGVVDLFSREERLSSFRSGAYFGEFDLSTETRRNASARARTPTVLHSLHRLAVSRGLAAALDRPDDERTLYTWLTRHGEATRQELTSLAGRIDVDRALAGLLADGSITVTAEGPSNEAVYRVTGARRQAARKPSLLATLFPE